ncbi:MAG: hypothetical protein ACYTAS_06790 [Planctomycetota bacterium]|jgi:translation initiation factor 1 (eIF-1/SUI1)
MTDEIMRELWSIKDAIAEEAGHDIDKLCQQLKERQATGGGASEGSQAAQEIPPS